LAATKIRRHEDYRGSAEKAVCVIEGHSSEPDTKEAPTKTSIAGGKIINHFEFIRMPVRRDDDKKNIRVTSTHRSHYPLNPQDCMSSHERKMDVHKLIYRLCAGSSAQDDFLESRTAKVWIEIECLLNDNHRKGKMMIMIMKTLDRPQV